MTTEQAIIKIGKELKFNHWVDRAAEMVRHMTNNPTTVSNVRVNENWPLEGTISFTRDADGKRIRLWHTRKAFKAKAV